MKMISGIALVLGAAVALSSTGAAPAQGAGPTPAQESAAQPSVPVFGVESSVVLVDVVVRDKKGRLVRDLTASDFEVYEDGHKQSLASFKAVEGPELAPQQRDDEPTAPAAPAAAAQPTAPPAQAAPESAPADANPPVIAFLFDRLSTEARDNAHKAALAYAARGHVDGDVVGVFALDLALHTVQPFTKDVSAVKAAFDRVSLRAQTGFGADVRAQGRQFNEQAGKLEQQLASLQGGGGADQATAQAVASLSVQRTFALLQAGMMMSFDRLERDQQGFSTTNGLMALVSGLKAIPGRKTIVFFSEGLSITTQVLQAFRDVIAMANRANVTVYAIDSAGLRTTSHTAEARDELNARMAQRTADLTRSGGDGSRGALTQGQELAENMLRSNARSGLGQLAEQTGGFLVVDTNDMSSGFQRIQEEMRQYYLLSYTPSNPALDGSYRALSVKVLRSGTVVHSRNGYVATKPDSAVPVRSFEAPAIAQLDRQPRPNDFPIGLVALSFPESERPGRVPVMVHVKGADLEFAPDKDKKNYRAQLSIVARVRDAQGREVDRLSRDYPLSVAAERLDGARNGEVLYFQETDLRPGRYTLEAAAWDGLARKASVRSSTFEVPAVNGTDLRLSSLMVLGRVEKLPPAEISRNNPLHYGEVIVYPLMGEPIRKSLSPALGFFFTVYGAPGAAAPKQAVVEVLKGGQSTAKVPMPLPAADANGRIQHAATLPTQPLAPGDYTLRVTVASGTQSATREASFVIVD